MKHLINIVVLCILALTWSCKEQPKDDIHTEIATKNSSTITYAEGFSIEQKDNYKILHIKNPWPKADKMYRYALIPRAHASEVNVDKNNFDAVILTPINKIIATSTTHIPSIELLDVLETLVGFPQPNYISSEKTRERIDAGLIRDVGKNEGLNTEVILEINPEVIMGFGMDNSNKSFEILRKYGVPIVYNGDWVEASPLAKAEWIKCFGVLYDKEALADSIFNGIVESYLEAKAIASKATKRPTILSGAMHKDIWYLPSGTSSEAQLLKDANVDYIWSATTGSGSLALNFETVLDKAQDADLWINPSYYGSLELLEKANAHYTQFAAFKNKSIFSTVHKTGATGGVLYFELGLARPDLVLKDLIKICHPELLEDYEPYFFNRLD